MRSITMAHDGSFLVAGNHKVREQAVYAQGLTHVVTTGRLLRMEDNRSPEPSNAIQSCSQIQRTQTVLDALCPQP
jgi:hypothetical protein